LPRWVRSIGLRVLLFNVLVVLIPLAGSLYLDIYEERLLEAAERAMVNQGRTLVSALSAAGDVNAETVGPIMDVLTGTITTRVRVLDAEGFIVGDSVKPDPPRPRDPRTADVEPEFIEDTLLYRLGSWPIRVLRYFSPPQPEPDYDEPVPGPDHPAVAVAMGGRYGAYTRITPDQRSVTLYSALPVIRGNRILGTVLVSRSTFRILQDLYAVRTDVFRLFLWTVVAAAAISVVLTVTITNPLGRLTRQAREAFDHRRQGRRVIQGTGGPTEIQELSGVLEQLTIGLDERIVESQRFAADLTHELKNPLASLGAAAQTVESALRGTEEHRFAEMMVRDVQRITALLDGARALGKLDAEVARDAWYEVDLSRVAEEAAESARLRGCNVVCASSPGLTILGREEPIRRAVDHLVDNACGFNDSDLAVELDVRRGDGEVVLSVRDRGPGIPKGAKKKIFHRFYSSRRSPANNHLGLGLAVVKEVAEGFGGSVRVRNDGGAVFSLHFPHPTSRIAAFPRLSRFAGVC
jgi:two-component system sensor histidine kinase ChvG